MVAWLMTSEENKLLHQQQQQQQQSSPINDDESRNNKKRRLIIGIIATILLILIILLLLAIIFQKYPNYFKNNNNDIDRDDMFINSLDNNNNKNDQNSAETLKYSDPKKAPIKLPSDTSNRYKSPPRCSSTTGCRIGWLFNNSQCYYFSSALMLRNYDDALTECKQMRGWLATIDDEYEKNFIFINTPLVQYWINLIKNDKFWLWNGVVGDGSRSVLSSFHSNHYTKSWCQNHSSSKVNTLFENAAFDSTVNDCFIQSNKNDKKRFICESCT
jgi:hypothetical protein